MCMDGIAPDPLPREHIRKLIYFDPETHWIMQNSPVGAKLNLEYHLAFHFIQYQRISYCVLGYALLYIGLKKSHTHTHVVGDVHDKYELYLHNMYFSLYT